MAQDLPRISANVIVPKPSLQKVFDNLRASGFGLVGPTVRDGAVVLDEISGLGDLPLGWTAEQGPGRYRLKQTHPQEYFSYGVTPQSWKRFLHQPQLELVLGGEDGRQMAVQAGRGNGTVASFHRGSSL